MLKISQISSIIFNPFFIPCNNVRNEAEILKIGFLKIVVY